MTLLVAGGGYGKTTALRQLAASESSRWLGLKAADREVETLSARVAEALDAGSPPGAVASTAVIGASDRRSLAEGQAAVICEGLDSGTGELLLVLDDVDQLEDDDSASQFLSTLCLQAPPRLHIVLSGRQLPALGLGAVQGRGELMELNAPDLAFTLEETASLLVERLGSRATALADATWSLTAGWAAALHLIADRLERLNPDRWNQTLNQLRLRRGSPWRAFAADLVDRQQHSARHILAIASVAPAVDADLLTGLDGAAHEAELDSLQARGFLVTSGEHGGRTLSPVLSEAVAEQTPAAEVVNLRRRIVTWLEQSGRLEEALECAVRGPRSRALSLLTRCGERLVARGYGLRVAEILRDLGTDGDGTLDTILAEARVAVGDWDGAMEIFDAISREAAGAPLAAAIAWRLGALLYLRSDNDAAREVLLSAYREQGPGTGDDALVAAWLSSTLWSCGDVDEAERVAQSALRRAEASGDASARAAAHVAAALAAAGRGDRDQNERHYRLALHAAARAGDSVQLARIHANLSSRATEEGDYAGAIREADMAISAGAGHNLFSALAMCNKAEAVMHRGELDEARALLSQAIEMFTNLGSLAVCVPYTQLGALDAERGDLARARASLERALRLAEESDDVHEAVSASARLAGILADDDPETARRYAIDAATRATSLERAGALCAWSWVELASGNHTEANRLATEAQAEARRTDDSPSLARAYELRAAASQPTDQAQLEEAAKLWREVGDPVASQRAELMLATCRGESNRADELRDQLSRRGVQPAFGVASLFVGQKQRSEVAVTTLGRFAVSRAGRAIPLVEWQSRKARDLLKLLVAREGHPVTRDAAAEALWPNEHAGPLANRLSVALSTLRKVLDPGRTRPSDYFIAADSQSLALRVDHVSIDVISFLHAANAGVALASAGDWPAAETRLRQAEILYTGDFLEEDLYEDWAVVCREEARSAAQQVSRLLARAATRRGDDEDATRHLRRLLERDPYDDSAWTALLGALLRLRRYGEARRQHTVYARRMSELAIPPTPLARTIDAPP